jgi:hypothetical protein
MILTPVSNNISRNGSLMNMHHDKSPDEMWTIARDTDDTPEAYVWESSEHLAMFLFSTKEVAEQMTHRLHLNGYHPLGIPNIEDVAELIESMAQEGIGFVATNPGKDGPIVIPINDVIEELQAIRKLESAITI